MMHALEDGVLEDDPTYAAILAADLEGRPKKLLKFKDEWYVDFPPHSLRLTLSCVVSLAGSLSCRKPRPIIRCGLTPAERAALTETGKKTGHSLSQSKAMWAQTYDLHLAQLCKLAGFAKSFSSHDMRALVAISSISASYTLRAEWLRETNEPTQLREMKVVGLSPHRLRLRE